MRGLGKLLELQSGGIKMTEFLERMVLTLNASEALNLFVAFMAGVLSVILLMMLVHFAFLRAKRALGIEPTVDELLRRTFFLRSEITQLRRNTTLNYSRFRDLASAWQSIAIIAGLVAGGLWTFTTFSDTRQRESAQLQFAKLQLETTKSFHFDLQLDAKQLTRGKPGRDGSRFVRVDISFKVRGNWIPDDSGTFDVGKAEFKMVEIAGVQANGLFSYFKGSERTIAISMGLGHRLGAAKFIEGTTATYSALQTVPRPGLYMVSFRGTLRNSPVSAVTYIEVT
jgi:type II secretory pathway pseudopilin PulG